MTAYTKNTDGTITWGNPVYVSGPGMYDIKTLYQLADAFGNGLMEAVYGEAYTDPAYIAVKLSYVCNEMRAGIANEIEHMGETNIPPIITVPERAEYTNYNELVVYTSLNVSISTLLEDGKIKADSAVSQILKALGIDALLDADIVFAGGTESLVIELSGEIGLDFSKLLSREMDLAKMALCGYFELTYSVIDVINNEVYHTQNLAKIHLLRRQHLCRSQCAMAEAPSTSRRAPA